MFETRRVTLAGLASALFVFVACATVPPPRVAPPVSPAAVAPAAPVLGPLAIDIVTCDAASDTATAPGACTYPVPGLAVHVNVAPGVFVDGVTNADGYALITIPAARRPLPDAYVVVDAADGWNAAETQLHPETCNGSTVGGCHNRIAIEATHVDPLTAYTLPQLAAVRGAMWPTASLCPGLSIPWGPRPGAPDNIIATDFFANYTADQQTAIIHCLRDTLHYTHVVIGPIVDSDGYHGQYAPHDWRWEDPAHANGDNFEKFLDIAQTFYDAGLVPIVFLHPDGWTVDQTISTLTPLLSRPRAQRLIRFAVPYGWEPGKYEISSCSWGKLEQWGRATLPSAIIAIHMTSDVDAPAGTDALCNDDDHTWNPDGNAGAWSRVAPFVHVWLIQNGPYAGTPGDDPQLATNFAAQFKADGVGADQHSIAWHLAGHAGVGWTLSAWGPGIPLCLVAAEHTSYEAYWYARPPEAGRQQWGDLAVASGACGYLDGGTVPVPLKR